MARFARDCTLKLPEVVHRLERFLGPGTGDLKMRFGLHSGPVTAGVLRGEKARFQLFGDTGMLYIFGLLLFRNCRGSGSVIDHIV